jgi:hypothetical protein
MDHIMDTTSRKFLARLTNSTNNHDKIATILAELNLENLQDYEAITSDAFKNNIKSIIVGNLNYLRKNCGYPSLNHTQENILISFLKAYQVASDKDTLIASQKYYRDMQIYFS